MDVVAKSAVPAPLRDCVGLLACPITGEGLTATASGLANASGSRIYPIIAGVPELFAPSDATLATDDLTERVKAFYEETPFPDYAENETRETLASKARRNLFVHALDAELPPDAIVLEAGCGTGQLTNFLGLSPGRRVFGGDICRNSLRLANEFRERQGIANAAFLQMNLFRPPFRPDSLDAVISNGVLHHTGDAGTGFTRLLRVLKPGGVIVIGLYNFYARLVTLARRRAFARFGATAYFLDRRVLPGALNESRRKAWFRDQYQHPHETRHSIDEVLGWFDQNNVEFLTSIPRADGRAFTNTTSLFEPRSRSASARRLVVQLKMLLSGGRDGGLYIMIGRKRA